MGQHTTSSLLIGRDSELELVLRHAAEARASEPRIVVITGEAGIGKTRLMTEATGRLSADGHRVLIGACLDIGDAGLPYLPIAQILRALVRETPRLEVRRLIGPAADDLGLIVPGLFEALPVDTSGEHPLPTAAATSGYGQARLFERMLGLVSRLADAAPTCLVIEDVHWIDRATRDLLTFLVSNLSHERLTLVLTSRVDDLARGHPILAWLAELGRSALAVRVELHRLDRPHVARQVQVIAGGLPDDEVVELIWRRSEGVPLFVEELSSALTGADSDEPREHLVEVLLTRLRGVSPACHEVLAVAAVAGRPVDEPLIASVMDRPADSVRPPLREALERGAIVMDELSGRCRFRHELLREAVERDLLPSEQRAWHERYAIILAARPASPDGPGPASAAAEVAYHWAAAGRVASAYRASIVAGAAAIEIHAYALAQQQYERALALEPQLAPALEPDSQETGSTALTDGVPSVDDPLALRRAAADAADLAGDADRAIELTREALTLVDATADPATAGVLHSRLGYLLWLAGDSAAALAEHERAVALVPDTASRERARVLGALGGALMGMGRWADSRTICEQAIACAAAAGAAGEESRARNMLGSDLVAMGDVDGGIIQLQEACRLASDSGVAEFLIVGYYNLGLNLLQADRFEEALTAAVEGLATARDQGLVRRFGQDLAALESDILLRLGRWQDAERAIDAGLTLDPRGVGTTYLSTVRARLLALRGDVAASATCLDAISRTTLEPDVAAYVAGVTAELDLVEGRHMAALAEVATGLQQLAGLADVLWTAPLVGLGIRAAADQHELARAAHDAAASKAARDAASPLFDKVAWLEDRTVTRGTSAWLAMARAEWSRFASEPDPGAWATVVSAWDAVPDPHAAAYARLRHAEAALRQQGIRADVGSTLASAHAAAMTMGARPLALALEALATRARVTLPTATTSGQPAGPGAAGDGEDAARALGLSRREIEVLRLVAEGCSNGQIAERLFISRKTAAVHVTHILDKLGVSNRVEAAMVAASIGLEPETVRKPAPDPP